MTERILALAVLPLWLTSTAGAVVLVAVLQPSALPTYLKEILS